MPVGIVLDSIGYALEFVDANLHFIVLRSDDLATEFVLQWLRGQTKHPACENVSVQMEIEPSEVFTLICAAH